MPIETICKGCARKLRVADDYAGRKARCPHCKTVYDVPSLPVSGNLLGESTTLPATTASVAMWRMRSGDGAVYGPVTKTELAQWCREGRVAADAELQEEGSARWVRAISMYPSLDAAAGVVASASSNPFASGTTPQATAVAPNPYSSPSAAGSGYYGAPHRGGMILTFGIISWVGCLFPCFLFSLGFAIAAWVMGRTDLAAMQAGQMDRSGQSSTRAGMILGMVNVGVTIAGVVLYIAFLVLTVMSGGF
ncbi:MAG: hypothetical protein CMJ64_25905 [Planctomycetaceae bacterium]|nr:hypothetical protein [Planctomycetaceae bacterium]